MAGGQANRMCHAWPAVGLAVLAFAAWATAGAQDSSLAGPVPTDGAWEQSPTSPLCPSEMPAARLANLADPVRTGVPRAWPCNGSFSSPTAVRTELGGHDAITESVLGRTDTGSWRPLPFSSILSEGWNEAWVPSPRGSGGAARQGWINAATGHLNRGGFFTFAYGAEDPPKSDAYLGSSTLMTPLNRRLMLITNVPFVLRNNVEGGQPIIAPPGPTIEMSRSHNGFGDISFTPRVLLRETKDFSLSAELAVLMPTGERPLARRSSLTPAAGFWKDLGRGWAIRGGIGALIPTRGVEGTTLINQLAVGQTLTEHDVPLVGDFTYYLSVVANTPLSKGDETRVTLTPGIRTHLGRDWYLLAGLPMPLTKSRVADLGVILWFVKAW